MRGKDLNFLTQVASMAGLEFAAPHMTLHTHEGRLYAQYTGAYAAGSRSIEQPKDIPDLDVIVDSRRFASLTDTFDSDAEVSIRKKDHTLSLQAGRKKLQFQGIPGARYTAFPDEMTPIALCDAKALAAEATLAKELNLKNTNTSPTSPIGTRLATSYSDTTLRVVAYDGYGAMLMTKMVCHEVMKRVAVVLTVPSKDLVTGLSLFEDGPIELGLWHDNFTIRNDSSWFRVAITAAKWPDFAKVIPKGERLKVIFTIDQLRSTAKAATVLNTEDVLEVVGEGEEVLLRTRTKAGEGDSYTASNDGHLDGSFWYGAEALLFASKLGKGDITLEITPPRGMPTIVRSDDRVLILSPKAI